VLEASFGPRECPAGGLGCFLVLCDGHLANDERSVLDLCAHLIEAGRASLFFATE
jgi:hypothetical protein